MKFFMSKGLSRAQAAGIVGNLIVESGDYLNPAEPGGGIGQWGGSRLTDLLDYEGGKPNFKLQVAFVWKELAGNPSYYGLPELKSATTYSAAATTFMNNYERPDANRANEGRRIENAKRLYHGDYGDPA
jgi:hypothetical protein